MEFSIETTGISPGTHRIIEVGVRVLEDRQFTNQSYWQYINPQRVIEQGAIAVHGITNEFVADKPVFADIADELKAFLLTLDALVIHNAPFDMGFLKMEFARCHGLVDWLEGIEVIDTLVMARERFKGQKNSLDALCKRFDVDNSNRDYHGALLDADLLCHVYLALTRKQSALAWAEQEFQSDQSEDGSLDFEFYYPISEASRQIHEKWCKDNLSEGA